MQYTDKVLEHFMKPRNSGVIPHADGVGAIGSEECGDMIRVWIKVAEILCGLPPIIVAVKILPLRHFTRQS